MHFGPTSAFSSVSAFVAFLLCSSLFPCPQSTVFGTHEPSLHKRLPTWSQVQQTFKPVGWKNTELRKVITVLVYDHLGVF